MADKQQIREFQSFIDKCRSSNYNIEIYIIKNKINDDIFEINLDDDHFTKIQKFGKSQTSNITTFKQYRYYHNDIYAEHINNKLSFKKETIHDKIELPNMIVVSKTIDDINPDLFPGLSNYDREVSENQTIININNLQIILKESYTNKKIKNCIIKVDNIMSVNKIYDIVQNFTI
tara:strand:+ start:3698 stop:4222 length:525 start_codon:yes stop_codon:yes gene_type:complete